MSTTPIWKLHTSGSRQAVTMTWCLLPTRISTTPVSGLVSMAPGAAYPGQSNPDFKGPGPGPRVALWVDFSEAPFSLLGLDQVGHSHWFLTSSNGGLFTGCRLQEFRPMLTSVAPSGAMFPGFCLRIRQVAGAPTGFDNISFQVPEPGSVLLVGLGLASIVIVRRKRRSRSPTRRLLPVRALVAIASQRETPKAQPAQHYHAIDHAAHRALQVRAVGMSQACLSKGQMCPVSD